MLEVVPSEADPATTILPSGWRTTAFAEDLESMEVLAMPLRPKELSRLPSGWYRARAILEVVPSEADPATTILPSGWRTIASA
jgi:uncharacterized protein YbdZ (MbtH family)